MSVEECVVCGKPSSEVTYPFVLVLKCHHCGVVDVRERPDREVAMQKCIDQFTAYTGETWQEHNLLRGDVLTDFDDDFDGGMRRVSRSSTGRTNTTGGTGEARTPRTCGSSYAGYVR